MGDEEMDSLAYIVFFCFAFPFLIGIPIVHRKMRVIMLFVVIGMVCCLAVAEVNGIINRSVGQSIYYVTTNITPITEEIAKMIPVLIFAVLVSDKREYLLAIAFSTGLGFALLENSTILVETAFEQGRVDILWVVIRTIGAGLLHTLCTIAIGVGITFIRDHRRFFICGTFALLSLAIVYHSIYNSLIQSEYRMIGAFMPLATYIPIVAVQVYLKKKAGKKRQAQTGQNEGELTSGS